MEEYKTVEDTAYGEITVERSRFIAAIAHVESESEALDFIAKKRAEYHDAKHNTYAYILRDGTVRSSDDGEPHGTAGKPMSDVICGNGLMDVCCVVTRYFGGVLLGTGGLVRAYGDAVKNAIENAKPVYMRKVTEYLVTVPYSDYEYLKKTAEPYGVLSSADYGENVTAHLSIYLENNEEFREKLLKNLGFSVKYEIIGEKIIKSQKNMK